MLLSIQDLRRIPVRDDAATLGRVTDCELDTRTWHVIALTLETPGAEPLRVPVEDIAEVDRGGVSLVAGSDALEEAPPARGDVAGRTRASELQEEEAVAADGKIGPVEDLVLETGDWRIGYLVLDAREWLPGRKVMVRPERVRRWDGSVHLDLTREAIRSAGSR